MKMLTMAFSVLVLLVSACASQPPVSIRVDLPTDLQIARVVQAPDNYRGSKVRWGGVIENVTNLQSETELEVIGKPLDKSARPVMDSKSSGRFLVRVSGFLEPTEFAANREITVVGKVSDSETRPIGEFEYTYPIVQAESYHLWEERVEPKYYYYDPWFYDPWYWGYPRYPWWYYY
ncbi:Slp family lipoprotein [Kaarinaea lacus]